MMSSPRSASSIRSSPEPLMTFGVIADIQYAPIPDGFSYGGMPRYYRHSLAAAEHAADHFQKEGVSLVINLGDTIDGKCQEADELCKLENKKKKGGDNKRKCSKNETQEVDERKKNGAGHDAIDDVVTALSVYKGRILHTYGNHELYNLSREEIGEKLKIPFVKEPCGDLVGYYAHTSECQNVKFVVLDSYDVAILQRCPESSRKRKLAEIFLEENNPNYPQLENSPEGLTSHQKRFVAFNGGIDEPQLEWLMETLEQAKNENQKVIILSHQPILPDSCSDVCLIWNYYDVLNILRLYKCTVAAAFAGHAHKGGYKRDELSGIHFRVFEATLESNDPIKTYGFVDVHRDSLVVRGEGDCSSAVYSLDHLDHSNWGLQAVL